MKKLAFAYPVPEEYDHPDFRRFFDYWVSLCTEEGLARKADFDPLALLEILGLINVAKVHYLDDDIRFQFTLWGTRNTVLFGGDFTGKFAEEFMLPTRHGTVQAAFEDVVRLRKPHFWHVRVPRPTREFAAYRRLALPFADKERIRVTDIVAFLMPDDEI